MCSHNRALLGPLRPYWTAKTPAFTGFVQVVQVVQYPLKLYAHIRTHTRARTQDMAKCEATLDLGPLDQSRACNGVGSYRDGCAGGGSDREAKATPTNSDSILERVE